jgi:hypothetical protein
VKIADLEDNMDIRRLKEIDEKVAARFRKYLAGSLLRKLKQPNPHCGAVPPALDCINDSRIQTQLRPAFA